MTHKLEFFFDCSSPWTYLAFESVQRELAAVGLGGRLARPIEDAAGGQGDAEEDREDEPLHGTLHRGWGGLEASASRARLAADYLLTVTTARRFSAQAFSLEPCTAGRSSP